MVRFKEGATEKRCTRPSYTYQLVQSPTANRSVSYREGQQRTHPSVSGNPDASPGREGNRLFYIMSSASSSADLPWLVGP